MIIGMVGKARSGKDTVAQYLVDHYKFNRVAFADKLKELAIKYFGLTEDECYDNKTDFSRRILQSLGVFVREEVDELFWVKYALPSAPDKNLIITDVRFINEAEYVKNMNGILVRIIRPDSPKIEYGENHISEIELEKIKTDITIINNKGIPELNQEVNNMIKLINNT